MLPVTLRAVALPDVTRPQAPRYLTGIVLHNATIN